VGNFCETAGGAAHFVSDFVDLPLRSPRSLRSNRLASDKMGLALVLEGECPQALENTHQENQPFPEQKINFEHDTQWLWVSKDASKLKGVCGPEKLEEMLAIIAEWLQPH
jgi:hypothetical protein